MKALGKAEGRTGTVYLSCQCCAWLAIGLSAPTVLDITRHVCQRFQYPLQLAGLSLSVVRSFKFLVGVHIVRFVYRDFLYFNDVYVFSLQSYAWHRVNAAGGPSPRSAPSLSTTPQGHLLVFGGYSRLKMKRDGVEKAVVHSDAWTLVPSEMPASSTTDSAKALAATSSGKKSAAKKSEPAPRWKWAKVSLFWKSFDVTCGTSEEQTQVLLTYSPVLLVCLKKYQCSPQSTRLCS